MPKMSAVPVPKVNIFIDLSEIRTFGDRVIFCQLIDEISVKFVQPNEFWDGCEIDGNNNRIRVNVEIYSDDVGDFMQAVCQAYEMWQVSKI